MILVYSLLEENRDRLISQLITEVRSQDRIYQRVSRAELKESISSLYDAFVEYLVYRNRVRISIALTYLVRSRLSQSFSIIAILKTPLCFISVLRVFLQESFRRSPEYTSEDYNKAMAYVEAPLFEIVGLISEIFEQHQRTAPKKTGDSSRLIIYRA